MRAVVAALAMTTAAGCVSYKQTDWRPPIVESIGDPIQFDIDVERCKDFATVATAQDPATWGELFRAAFVGALTGAAAGAAIGGAVDGGSGAAVGSAAGAGAGGIGGGTGIAAYGREEHQRRRRQATTYCLRKLDYEVIAY